MMLTYTGKILNPTAPHTMEFDIEDIAHALACVNRFAGHAAEPISVAQHSVYVAMLCPEHCRLQGLLHDASEAYIGDVTKWLKQSDFYSGHRLLENLMQQYIYERFQCRIVQAREVTDADWLMVRFEGEMAFGQQVWRSHADRYGDKLLPITPAEREQVDAVVSGWYPWHWRFARARFLHLFSMLYTEPQASAAASGAPPASPP